MPRLVQPEGSMDLIPQFDADGIDMDAAIEALRETGVILVGRDDAFASRFREPLRALDDNTHDFSSSSSTLADDFLPESTKRVGNLLAHVPATRGLCTDPISMELCDATIGKNCESWQVHAGPSALVPGPGAEQQVLHTEDGAIAAHLYRAIGRPAQFERPDLILASMLCLSDFTLDNGGTHVVPYSHRWDRKRLAEPDEVVAVCAPAGATVYWLGGVLHAAGANVTQDAWRQGIIITWSCGWLRQESNQYLSIPVDLANELAATDPMLLALLGYAYHDALGGYDSSANRQPKAPPPRLVPRAT